MPAHAWEDALTYRLSDAKAVSSDGVFIMREDGWQAVRYIREENIYTGSFMRQATAGIVNVTDTPLNVELSFIIDQGSHGNVMLVLGNAKIGQFEPQAGRMQVRVVIEPGYSQIYFINQLAEPVRLRDIQLMVLRP
jgi:hypothetical protein